MQLNNMEIVQDFTYKGYQIYIYLVAQHYFYEIPGMVDQYQDIKKEPELWSKDEQQIIDEAKEYIDNKIDEETI